MEKYVNDEGQIGVLVSSGFGAGWATWSALLIFWQWTRH